MAFDAFLSGADGRPRGRRRLVALSGGFHLALLLAGVAFSFWHVEELTPPMLRVSFLATPLSPPPAPPPAARKRASPVKTTAEVTQPRPDRIVQPRPTQPEPTPTDEDEGSDDGVEGGVEGGVAGGIVGGVVGGVLGAVAPALTPPERIDARVLPPAVGAQQRIHSPEPHLPEAFRRVGASYTVMLKICVTPAGAVSGTTLLQSADPAIDQAVIETVATWRFRPLTIDGRPVPFCYATRFQFVSGR